MLADFERRMVVGASCFRDVSLLQGWKIVPVVPRTEICWWKICCLLQKHWEGDGSSPNTIQFQYGV